MLETISSNAVVLLTVIGVLAFLVSAITEVTKNIGILAKVPTDLQVIVLSLILCLLAYFSYVSYINTVIIWYYVAGAIIGSFIVSFVAMYGWDKLTQLWNRFQTTSKEGK
jgi:hypothetical protein